MRPPCGACDLSGKGGIKAAATWPAGRPGTLRAQSPAADTAGRQLTKGAFDAGSSAGEQPAMRHLLSPAAWGLLAGLTGLAGYIPYLRDAWRRTSDPDPAAWLIWTLEYSVLLAVQAAQHPPWAALCLATLQLAGTAAVLAVLAARGGWRFGTARWILLGGGVAIMTLWPFAHAPGLAMCLVLAVEGAAMVLVMIGAYRRPGGETPLTWQAFILAGLLDLPALGRGAPRLLYVYPAFFVVMGSGVLIAAALGARAARVPAQRQRYLAQDREHAPAPRAACPAGQWPIFAGMPRALADPGPPPGVPRLSQPRARPCLGPAREVLRPSQPQAAPHPIHPQARPHPTHRPGLLERSLGDGGRGPGEDGDRVLGGEPGQAGQDEERFRADHRGQVPLELGQPLRIRGH